MKKQHFSLFHRLSAFLLVALLAFSSVTPAFAAESTVASEELSSDFELLTEDSAISREEALEILGMTEEEYGDAPIYIASQTVDLAETRASTLTFNSGDVKELGYLTFTGSANGSTMMAFKSSHARYGVAWWWLNPNSRTSVILNVKLKSTNIANPYPSDAQLTSGCGYGDGDKTTAQSNTFAVSSSCSYSFQYSTRYSYSVEDFGPIKVKVYVVVAGI